MGLITETQADLVEAFNDDLSDIVKEFDLILEFKNQYSTTSGKYYTRTELYPGRGIFEDYETREITDNAKIGDKKLIILANEVSKIPEIDNKITDENRKDYIVINVKNVFDIVYEVQLREH